MICEIFILFCCLLLQNYPTIETEDGTDTNTGNATAEADQNFGVSVVSGSGDAARTTTGISSSPATAILGSKTLAEEIDVPSRSITTLSANLSVMSYEIIQNKLYILF